MGLAAVTCRAGEESQEWRHEQGDPSEESGFPVPTPPASCLFKVHTCSARLSVSVCNLEAASGPGTLESSKSRAPGPPNRVRVALPSCRAKVTACCSQAALEKERC